MDALDPVAREFLANHSQDCSYRLFNRRQWLECLCLVGFWVWIFFFRWDLFLIWGTLLSAAAYLAVALFKLLCVIRGSFARRKASQLVAERIPDDKLPVYTLLIPVYKEANVLPGLLQRIRQLDYPEGLLDVKLLMEEDDPETVAVAESMNLPAYFERIVLPDGKPKTKPKACNVGLQRAKGEYVVIFDAEDRPEPDQLRKVLQAFAAAPADVICMQCRLDYYNANTNWLTRCFTVEYATWFRFYLEGLQHMGVPVPLGGTSNHFKTEVLREIGGWDPFNVTEDCDLGVRLHKRRYRTRTVDSTTWEEATSRVGNWIRQRSRWVKGYFQTWFTHLRHPLRTLKGLGLRGFLGFTLVVGGHSLLLVLNFVFWALLLFYLGNLAVDISEGRQVWEVLAGDKDAIRNAWRMIYTGKEEHWLLGPMSWAFFIISCTLLLGNLFFILMGLIAVVQSGRKRLAFAALTMPLYWILISIGACKGLYQCFTKLHYWEKTRHGDSE